MLWKKACEALGTSLGRRTSHESGQEIWTLTTTFPDSPGALIREFCEGLVTGYRRGLIMLADSVDELRHANIKTVRFLREMLGGFFQPS